MRKRAWGSIGISSGVILLFGMMVWETRASGGRLADYFPVVFAAVLHEVGHLTAARLCHVKVSGLRLDLFGARFKLDGLMSYGTEWLIAAAGPLCNLLSAAVALLWWQTCSGEMTDGMFLFSMASLVLGIINLLPIGTLDGGRMLYCTCAHRKGVNSAAGALRLTTTFCLMLLWLGSGYILIRTGGMLTLFVFALCLLLRVSLGESI